MLDDSVKTLAERGIEPIGAEGAPRSVHTERRIVHSVLESVSDGDLTPVELTATNDELLSAGSTEQQNLAQKSGWSEGVPPQESMRDSHLDGRGEATDASLQPRRGGHVTTEDSVYLSSAQNDRAHAENDNAIGDSKPEKRSRSTPLRQSLEKKPSGNPVVEGLGALEERFRKPQCSQCSAAAQISVYTYGPAITCSNPGCNKVDRLDVQILQSLAESLRLTCRQCRSVSLRSIKGPIGNFLKCSDCQENTSWQFIAGYGRKV